MYDSFVLLTQFYMYTSNFSFMLHVSEVGNLLVPSNKPDYFNLT